MLVDETTSTVEKLIELQTSVDVYNMGDWFENAQKNLDSGVLDGIAPVTKLFNTFNGDCIIVGAGPSLDESIEQIKALQKNAFIIVADRALKTLVENGVIPDVVMTGDKSQRVLEFLEPLENTPTMVVANIVNHPKVWNFLIDTKCKLYLYGCEAPFSHFWSGFSEIYPELANKICHLETGSVVLFSALDMACKMGFRRIVTIGNDLSCGKKSDHKWEKEIDFNPTLIELSDGILTSPAFCAAADSFGLFASRSDTPELIDCSGGLKKENWKTGTLAEIFGKDI